jgi:hypothetical protein
MIELGTVAPEIINNIFSFLSANDSTCLGLTYKRFYTIHRSLHGTVPLLSPFVDMDWDMGTGHKVNHEKTLGERLQDWAGTGYWLDWRMAHLQVYHSNQRSDFCIFVPQGQKLRDARGTFSVA